MKAFTSIRARYFGRYMTEFILIGIYRVVLDYSYVLVMSPTHTFRWFPDHRTIEWLVISWTLLILCCLFWRGVLQGKDKTISSRVLFFIFTLSYVPFTSCVSFGIISIKCVYYNFIYHSILIITYLISCKFPISKRMVLSFSGIKIQEHIWRVVVLLMLLNILYISISYTGLRFIPNYEDIYIIRKEAGNYHLPTIISYIYSMSRTFLAFVIGYYLLEKRFILAAVVFLAQLLSYSIDGARIVLVYLFFTLISMVFFYAIKMNYTNRIEEKHINNIFMIALVFILILGCIEMSVFESFWINGMVLRRLLLVPNYLHDVYLSFFLEHEPDYFQSGIFRHLGFESDYASNGGISRVIGAYLGHPSMNANNGMLSDAVAQLGGMGIFIMPLIIIILLRFFDKCSVGLDGSLKFICGFQLFFSLLSLSLGTVMLSNGSILISIFMISIQRNMKDNINISSEVDNL